MAGSTRDYTYALRINTEDAKGKIPEVTGEAKASLEGLSGSTVQSGEEFKTWGEKVREAAAGTGKMEVSVTELAHALNEGKINLDQYKAALGPIKTAEDEAALALGRFTDAMAKMGAAEENPRKLGRAVVQARIATDELVAATQKLGKPIPPEFENSIKRADAAIESMNRKVAIAKDTAGDMATKQKFAAQGMESMASAGGSVESMMGQLANANQGLGGSFAKAGLATMGVVAAFGAGFEAAKKLREVYQELTGRELPNLTNWVTKLWTGVENATGAYERHGVVARSAIGIHNAHAQAISALTARIVALVPEWNKSADALKTSNAFAKEFDALLKELAADHQDISKFSKEHADSIISTLAPALKAGTISVASMTAEMRLAVRAALDASTAHQQEAKAIADATAKVNERRAAEEKAIATKLLSAEKEVAAAGDAISAIYRHRDEQIKALKAEEISIEEFNKRKAEINKKASEDVDAATEKEAEALGKVEEAHEDYRASQEKAAKALSDATTAAGEQAKAYDQVRDAMAEVNEAFDGVKSGSSSTATEIGKAAEAIKSLGPVSDLAKQRCEALKRELNELTDAAIRAQNAFAGSKT